MDRELENVSCMNSVCVLCYPYYITMTCLKVAYLKSHPALPKFPEMIKKEKVKPSLNLLWRCWEMLNRLLASGSLSSNQK